jgi:hypothetical protein
MLIDPPVLSDCEVSPAVTVMLPPWPLSPAPTETSIAPPPPISAVPVAIRTEPVFPDEEEPVVNSTRPDAPISPPFIVDVVIEPDVDVDPYPDLMKTDPPVSDPPIPA